jgi:multicomponent Na+:H+ antiporter subunit D
MGEVIHSAAPLWACLASLLAVIPIYLLRRQPNLREGATFVAGFVKLGLVLSIVAPVLEGKVVEYTLCELVPGVPIQFRVDGLGALFALVASSLWIVTSLYSIGYMRGLKEHAQTRYYSFFAVSLSATLGVAFSANLLTLYLFYEMLSLATFPLVTHHQDREARTGGRTYLTYLLGTSVGFVLPALIFCYVRSGGDLDFNLAGFLAGKVSGGEATIVLLLLVFGFAKAGIMPFHSWLPGAMVAPTPVSALLHAVAVVKVGVFCVIRVVTGVFGVDLLAELDLGTMVVSIASFTVLASSLIALTQDNLKRRLAFSTVGQLSYIVLGCALLTPDGTMGSILHIAMHAVGKITLFMCAGAIFVATGKKYVSEMTGIGRQMPVTMGAFFIGAMSVIGLPPTGGFVSKWFLVTGAFDSGRFWVVAVLLLSSLLNIAYLIPPVVRAFFMPAPEENPRKLGGEAPEACLVPIVLTATGCILLFIYPDALMKLAGMMVVK